jgi:hypothetical protein
MQPLTLRGCVRASRLLVLMIAPFFICLPSFGQMAETTPAPPAHLPRLIGECETGPNYFACSVWMWNGTAYTAIWGNGAIGQMTVESGDSQDLKIQRTDTAGTFAGFSGTYTGKWDGKSISNGQMSFTFKTISATVSWVGNPTVTPVLTDTQQNYSFVNWFPAQLTGYAIFNQEGSFNSSLGTEINDYRLRGESPMNPGESRRFTDRYMPIAPNYAKGVTYPQASAIAAVYSDGTTFGDPGVLAVMMDQRRGMISALTDIGATICTMGKQGASVDDIQKALGKQQANETAQSAAEKGGSGAAYTLILKALNGRASDKDVIVRRALDKLTQVRAAAAADPVKDASGRLAISAPPALSCNLP